jgi:hypothetical protein
MDEFFNNEDVLLGEAKDELDEARIFEKDIQ